MIRLLNIELYKLRHSKYFWVLMSLFTLFLISVPVFIDLFMDNIGRTSVTREGESIVRQVSFFYTRELWQNLTYIYKFGSILLAFLVVISLTSEYSYETIKQNIIDGLSRKEFVISKLLLVVSLAVFFTLVVFIIGAFTTLAYTGKVTTDHLEYLGYYFLYLLNFLLFAVFVSNLIKKSGMTIAFLFFYLLLIEPIIGAILEYGLELTAIVEWLPLHAINNLIFNPFTKIILKNSGSLHVNPVIPVVVYIFLYVTLFFRSTQKRDL